MPRIVADLGNSRLKWGSIGQDGRLGATVALPTDDLDAWSRAWHAWGLDGTEATWSIASVNPPLADRLGRWLDDRGAGPVRWHRSAAEVLVRHDLENPRTAGADRALAVVGALGLREGRGPGLVVSCGTAVTVERISAEGIWQGGAIAPGLGPMARALHLLTAQLPEVAPVEAPAPFGRSTVPALEAGVFWGVVGTIRELLARQSLGLTPLPWLIWTGGDAPTFAPWVEWPGGAEVVPHLVLEGLRAEAFCTEIG
jgi:type III pantothenate kinase